MEEALIEALITAVDERGLRADSGYKKEAWEYAKREVSRVAGPAKSVSIINCKNKHDSFKKDWKTWQDLTSLSGFSLDERGVVTRESEALDAYFRAHPEARKFKKKPLAHIESLRHLFSSVLATREAAMSIEDLLDPAISIERDASIEQYPQPQRRESEALIAPRKRSASSSVTSSVRMSKRDTSSQAVEEGIGGLATQLKALVTAMSEDYQRDALRIFQLQYQVLHPALQLAIVAAFEKEYTAKFFCMMKPDMRRRWVHRELLNRREIIVATDLEEEQFEQEMESIDWFREGDLVLKVAESSIDEVEIERN